MKSVFFHAIWKKAVILPPYFPYLDTLKLAREKENG